MASNRHAMNFEVLLPEPACNADWEFSPSGNQTNSFAF